MSFEKIDQYVKELEAIKYYDKIKAENIALITKVKELETKLLSEKKKLEELLKINKDLEEQIKLKDNEVKALRNELRIKEEKIKELEEELKHLKSRVRELEELKILTEGKTLKEAEEYFLKVKENEIKILAKDLFNKFKSEWERKDKPKEVMNEAIKLLNHILEQLSKSRPPPIPKEVIDTGLLEKVREILNSEVEKRINAEFLRRVEEVSEHKALEKLEKLKSIEWPNWYKSVVEPRILQLESKLQSNIIKTLKGPWLITCDKCRTIFQVELTTNEVEDLLRTGDVMTECPNPNCVDTILFITSKHKIRITLRDLIESLCLS